MIAGTLPKASHSNRLAVFSIPAVLNTKLWMDIAFEPQPVLVFALFAVALAAEIQILWSFNCKVAEAL
jgi:hypothetical protein